MDAQGPPPFGWSVNGQPVETRDGQQIKNSRRQRVMLQICEPCNGAMNTAIEVPAKEGDHSACSERMEGAHQA